MEEVTEDGGLRRLFSKTTFDGDRYVKTIAKSGDMETNRALATLNRILDDTSTQMKKAIYENYNLFIDAGKAVSQLERQMHLMHHDLNEQQRLLNNLVEIKLLSDHEDAPDSHLSVPATLEVAKEKSSDDSRKSLAALLESVEGSSSVAAVPGRHVLFEGDLRELSPDTFSVVSNIHVFLMNDGLLVTVRLAERKGPLRYRRQAWYELGGLAVVNLREREGQSTPSHAFKIMVFPDTRVFQTESQKAKNDWMEALEKTKRKEATEKSKRRESTIMRSRPLSTCINPFDDASSRMSIFASLGEAGGSDAFGGLVPPKDAMSLAPSDLDIMITEEESDDDWQIEAPENLDVWIAERNFSAAVDLIEEVHARLAKLGLGGGSEVDVVDGASSVGSRGRLTEFRARIDQRVVQLTEALQMELVVGAERHSGGVRSVRNAVTQLIRLGKASLACELFLDHRSSLLSHQLSQVRQEGSQQVYLIRLSFAFHRGILESGKEFQAMLARPGTKERQRFISRFCTWCADEADKFGQQLRLLLIDSRSISFYAMALATERIHLHSDKVTELLGVDMTFHLNNALLESWQRAVEEQARVLRDAVDHRAMKEQWLQIEWASSKESDKFFSEMEDAQIPEVRERMTSANHLGLTASSCQFAKSLCLFADSAARLRCRNLYFVVSNCVVGLVRAELRHYTRCLTSQQFLSQENDSSTFSRHNFIMENMEFLLLIVLPKVEAKLDIARYPGYADVKKEMRQVLAQSKGYSV